MSFLSLHIVDVFCDDFGHVFCVNHTHEAALKKSSAKKSAFLSKFLTLISRTPTNYERILNVKVSIESLDNTDYYHNRIE